MSTVDLFLEKGCGRCKYYDTPQCRVHDWQEELVLLRALVLASGLNEEIKWGMPTYTLKKSNVVMVIAFREYAAISFFKGSLLKDPEGLLIAHGENSQAARTLRFTSSEQIRAKEDVIRAYINEAIEMERSGQKVQYKTVAEYTVPAEFQVTLDERPDVKAAFEALTPGRQRAYILYFEGAKQVKTREARIEKCIPQILAGKGLNE